MKRNAGLYISIITIVSQIILTVIYYVKEINAIYNSQRELWEQFIKSDFAININNFVNKNNINIINFLLTKNT